MTKNLPAIIPPAPDMTPDEERHLEESSHGLSAMQLALVENMLVLGMSQTEAALAAGYSRGQDRNGAAVAAHRVLRLPKVQAYMVQRVHEALATGSVRALSTIMQLASSAKSDYVRLEAAKDVLDRAGFKPVERKQVQVAGNVSISIDLGE
jgi:hypothetical protein